MENITSKDRANDTSWVDLNWSKYLDHPMYKVICVEEYVYGKNLMMPASVLTVDVENSRNLAIPTEE